MSDIQAFEDEPLLGLTALCETAGPAGSGILFRGNCKANRESGLATGLELLSEAIDGNLTRARQREDVLLREFKRRAHHYLSDEPGDEQVLEWFALMQHHGAPTRLLDWTYSPHVALHFAIRHALSRDSEPVVWRLDLRWCVRASMKAAAAVVQGGVHALPRSADSFQVEARAAQELRHESLPPSVWPVNPFRLNERLTIQKGGFLAPADIGRPFVENLTALEGYREKQNITKYVLPKEGIPKMLGELYTANVTEASLFPGLDGFARSLWASARFLAMPNQTDDAR